MTPGPPVGDDPPRGAGSKLERRSFHTRLLFGRVPNSPDPGRSRPLPATPTGASSRDVEREPASYDGLAMRAAFLLIQRPEVRRPRRDVEAGPGPGRPSFHSRLVAGPEPSPAEPKRARPLPSSPDRWSWIVRLLGQGALFVGGLAVGGGVILARRGEALMSRPALLIGFGAACLLFAILAQVLARESARRPTSAARG